MKTFHLEILSPERAFFTGECVSLTVPLHDGMYGIMADHVPLTAAIIPGELSFTTPDGARSVCAVSQGMIDVEGGVVKVLCESALAPDEIDEERERLAAESAAEDMKGRQSYKEYMLSQVTFAHAVNNLRVKKHDAAKINNQ